MVLQLHSHREEEVVKQTAEQVRYYFNVCIRHGPKPGSHEAEAEAFTKLEAEAEALTLINLEAEALVMKPKPGYLYYTQNQSFGNPRSRSHGKSRSRSLAPKNLGSRS